MLTLILLTASAGCSVPRDRPAQNLESLQSSLRQIQTNYVPVDHLGLYSVALVQQPNRLVLTGVVDCAEARTDTLKAAASAGITVVDQIKVLPDPALGDRNWGIGCVSVSTGREQADHKSEIGTQVLMGGIVRVMEPSSNAWWYLVQTTDRYPGWLEKGTFVRCTFDRVREWTNSPLLIVTAFETLLFEHPAADSAPVSDLVTANLVKKLSETGDWFEVELPDYRRGFVAKSAAEDYGAWLAKRRPTAANIEHTARQFLGRPYLWGGNSPKGFDCSGFTKTVFFLNGIDLGRNASHQARQGSPVPLDPDFSQVKPGDLLFFGRPARRDRPERVHHVAIYLGNKLFIHSSELVQINSLDPASPIRDEFRIRTLLRARRVL